MKFIPAIITLFSQRESTKRNFRFIVKFIITLICLVTLYSVIFHYLMELEGRNYSWISGFYWTFTVMTTLGFGDITFKSDIGRAFSILVMLSGVVFLLTLLPFMFIRFLYIPWVEAEARNRTPRELSPGTKNHVIMTSYDSVTAALIEKMKNHHQEYVLIIEDHNQALQLYDEGLRVVVGNIDDPATYRKMNVDQAALVVATNRDEINANISFTVRELSDRVRIVTTADSPFSEDILGMAGSSRVLQIYEILGRSLAAWTVGGDCRANVISRFDSLIIAEFPVMDTPLVGKTLAESRLRERFGVSVVGIWERGKFELPAADSLINRNTVLVLAGTEESLADYNEIYSFYHICHLAQDPVIIVGGGRVGHAIAKRFKERGTPYLIIEKHPRRALDEEENVIAGDAADIRTLKEAWIEKAPAALITTHDDAINIYLTKYLRSLRPDMQILSRATMERNVSTLHRAGADFVMSYASLGANTIFNYLRNENTLMLAEGLSIFRLAVPKELAGKKLVESRIREFTNCSVVAIKTNGQMSINPDPQIVMDENAELILIGTYDAEKIFHVWDGQ